MDKRGIRRTMQGVVIKNKMDKTVIVLTERLVKHPKFHKYMRKHVRYKAHDEQNNCNVGDMVLIVESRPLSRQKRWRVREVLQRAE